MAQKKDKAIAHLLVINRVSVTSLWACRYHGYLPSTSSVHRVSDSAHAWTSSMSPCRIRSSSAFPPSATSVSFLFPSLVHHLSLSLSLMLSLSRLHRANIRAHGSNQRIRLFYAHQSTTQVLNCPDRHVICIEKNCLYDDDLSPFLIPPSPLTLCHAGDTFKNEPTAQPDGFVTEYGCFFVFFCMCTQHKDLFVPSLITSLVEPTVVFCS